MVRQIIYENFAIANIYYEENVGRILWILYMKCINVGLTPVALELMKHLKMYLNLQHWVFIC